MLYDKYVLQLKDGGLFWQRNMNKLLDIFIH